MCIFINVRSIKGRSGIGCRPANQLTSDNFEPFRLSCGLNCKRINGRSRVLGAICSSIKTTRLSHVHLILRPPFIFSPLFQLTAQLWIKRNLAAWHDVFYVNAIDLFVKTGVFLMSCHEIWLMRATLSPLCRNFYTADLQQYVQRGGLNVFCRELNA